MIINNIEIYKPVELFWSLTWKVLELPRFSVDDLKILKGLFSKE